MPFSRGTKLNSRLQLAVCLWTACVLLSSLSFLAIKSFRSSDLVFCPLQKQWVKKSPPLKSRFDIGAICASDKLKALFVEGLVRSSRILSPATDGESLFLAYTAKGNGAFAELPTPNAPDSPPLSLVRNEASANVNQIEVVFCRAEVFSLKQPSHSPVHENSVSFSGIQFYPTPELPSSISPRGPPFSL